MTASTVVKLLPGDEAYVPRIKVVVDNQSVSEAVLDDVIDLKVTLQRDELGGFTLQLANHFEVPEEPTPRAPVTGTTAPEDSAVPPVLFRHSDDQRFDVFKPISIQMGYVDRLVTLFVGEITALQPTFPSSGMPTFTVTGSDLLQRLRRSKPDGATRKAFPGLADWQIARLIASRHRLQFSAKSNTTGTSKGEPTMQRDMDDLQFVLYLAKRNDYECCAILDEAGTPELYFGKATDKRDGAPVTQIELAYGESLIAFTPKLRIASQVAKVTVRGWNARTKQKFEYTATDKDLPKTGGTGTTGPALVEKQLGAKEERIVDRPVQSQDEARTLAIQLLTETANQFLSGSGEAMGAPEIVPGVNLTLQGLGTRYNGTYYVTRADHVFGASGYTTSFEVERLRDELPRGKQP